MKKARKVYKNEKKELFRGNKARKVLSWRGLQKQRIFFDFLAKKLNFRKLDDWYKISLSSIQRFGGSGLLSFYSNSPIKALRTIYPEHDWKIWKFSTVPSRFWFDKYNRRNFFDWLGQELGYTSFACWYKISGNDIKKHGGSCVLIDYYNGSGNNALKDIYPEYPWIPWRFYLVPKGYWSDLYNQKLFVEYLGKELGYSDIRNFYSLRINDISFYGGSGILRLYNNSPFRLLNSVYPEFNWSPSLFKKSPRSSIAPKIFDHALELFSLKNPLDWLMMPLSNFKKFGIRNNVEFILALKQMYPELQWDLNQFENARRKLLQWKLRSLLEEILEKEYPKILEISVLENYWGLGENSMELDIFVPSLNLAFEYQGIHHFKDHCYFGLSKDFKLRDEKKRVTCKKVGITLIEVYYNMKLDEISVMELVRRDRPDIFY